MGYGFDTIQHVAHIAFIGTGGTFSNEGTGALDYLGYLHAGKVLPTNDVLALMPDVSDIARITPIPFTALRSKAIGPREWIDLARLVTEACADPGTDGVIITHGTGVLEETAYFLHLTVNTTKPVAIIGAQRPPTTVGSDAQKNFVDAVHWIRAHSREDGGQGDGDNHPGSGVVLVMDQQVHGARGVAKLANHTLSAMESPVAGPIARVNVDGTITEHRQTRHRHTVTSEFAADPVADDEKTLPRVDIVHQYAGSDATALNAYVTAGAQGVVVVGFPPGTNTPALDAAIAEHVAGGVEIVQASRAIRDPQILHRADLEGMIVNSDLSPQQARVLLMLALAQGYSAEEIQRAFEEY